MATAHEKIMVLKRDGHGADAAAGDRHVRAQIDRLAAAAATFEPERIKAALKEIVPEYVPANSSAPA